MAKSVRPTNGRIQRMASSPMALTFSRSSSYSLKDWTTAYSWSLRRGRERTARQLPAAFSSSVTQ